MKVTLGKDGKPKHAPFYVDLSIQDFGGDPNEYHRYLSELDAQYQDERRNAQNGEPVRSEFAPTSVGDRAYNAAVQRWAMAEGMEEALEKSENRRREQTPAPQMPRELAALHFGDGDDKQRSVELMEWCARVTDQLEKAAKYRDYDGRDTKRVLEARQRAAQYQREVDKLQKEKYTFEEKQDSHAVKWGEEELRKAMKMKPEEVEKNIDHINGLIQGYRQMADTPFSFTLDGYQVVEINHPFPANELEARMGTTEPRHLLQNLGMHGIERHEEPAPEKEEEAPKPISEITMGEYNKYVAGENAKAAEKAKDFTPTVRPGMFGG